MTDKTDTRRSHCSICGKRLSLKTTTGDVRWVQSHIDEKGIFCDACYRSTEKTADKKKIPRT